MSPNESAKAVEEMFSPTVYAKPIVANICNCHYIGAIQQTFLSIYYMPAMVKTIKTTAVNEVKL